MKINVLILLMVALIAASCSPIYHKTTSAKVMDIDVSGVIQHPIIAELEVRERKVTGEANAATGTSVQILKNTALANALAAANADVIIEPLFMTFLEDGRIHAVVSGYPAYYTNFRQATIEDVPLLQIARTQNAALQEPIEVQKAIELQKAATSTNRGYTIFGLVLLAAVAILSIL